MDDATEGNDEQEHIERIRAQAETLVNRWRTVSYGIEPEAVLEAGLAATVQFLRAFADHGERRLVCNAIGRLAQALRPLTDPPADPPAEGAVPEGAEPEGQDRAG